jgi:K+/H+ antiporter YhaU regulatory subunit KhtT
MSERIDVVIEHDEFDWGKVEGVTLKEAAAYLARMAEKLPPDAFIDEHWTGYEDMKIRVISLRKETDQEYAVRKQQEESKEVAARIEKEAAERAKRLAQYNQLKKEFEW